MKYNWIKAYCASQNSNREHEVFIRQTESRSEYFVDDEGARHHISELDLTRSGSDFEPQIFNLEESKLEEFERRNKELEQQTKESQAMYMEMLSKLDANSIADHKAKIDEREYWRKQRVEIFLKATQGYDLTNSQVVNVVLKRTDEIIKALYEQDKAFFKDNQIDSLLPIDVHL